MIKVFSIVILVVLCSCGQAKYGSRDYSSGSDLDFNIQPDDLVQNEKLELNSKTIDFTDSLISEFEREMTSLIIDSTALLVTSANEVIENDSMHLVSQFTVMDSLKAQNKTSIIDSVKTNVFDSLKVQNTTSVVDSIKTNVTIIDSVKVVQYVVDTTRNMKSNDVEVEADSSTNVGVVFVPIISKNDSLSKENNVLTDSLIDKPIFAVLPIDSISSKEKVALITIPPSTIGNDEILLRQMKDLEQVVSNQSLILEKLLVQYESMAITDKKVNTVPEKKVEVKKEQVINFYFNSGKTIPNINERDLNAFLKILSADSSLKVLLSGMTDQSGSQKLNYELSKQRTEKVKELFVSRGVSQSRIFVQYLGETKSTLDVNENERRVECTILK